MPRNLHPSILMLIFFWGAMYALFPLKIQAVESYIYATAIEGNYDLRSTFAEANPGSRLPDFARLHPNHPLPHFVVGKVFDIFKVGALTGMKMINFVSALAATFFLYLICRMLLREPTSAILGALVASSTAVFWGLALSGEVHMPAFALLTVAGFFLTRFLLVDGFDARALQLAALFFTLAGMVHIAALFSALPALPALWLKMRRIAGHGRWLHYAAIALFCILGIALVYVLLPVLYFGIANRKDYFDFVSIYAHLRMPELKGNQWLSAIAGTYLQSFISGNGAWAIIAKITLGAWLLWGYVLFLRSTAPAAVRVLFVSAPVAYFLSHLFFSVRPDAINGWLFVLPSAAVAAAYAFARARAAVGVRFFSYPMAVVTVTAVFIGTIMPNAALKPTDYAYLSEYQPAETQGKHAVVIATDPVLTFPDVYEFKYRRNFASFNIIWACCGRTAYLTELKTAIQKREIDVIIADELNEGIPALLYQTGRPYATAFEKSGIVQPAWLPSSIYFTRPAGYTITKRIVVYNLE